METDNIILLGHGSGGRMSQKLISSLFFKYFSNDILEKQTDAALITTPEKTLTFTTDGYVVEPIFFPGGNIGKLAVCGTVNDLAVCGSKPLFITASFIIEEGLSVSKLEEIVSSMAEEAAVAGVKIVAGDTKVVNRGKCDKIFITTSGIGVLNEKHQTIATAEKLKPGDAILINGTVGDHGMAIMAQREALHFTANIQSDCACLNHLIGQLLDVVDVKFMRDATRGGLASVLNELAQMTKRGITIDEEQIPVKDNVRGICEILGFDPIYVANEGKIVIVVDKEDRDKALTVLKNNRLGKDAACIGYVNEENTPKVIMHTTVGGKRIVDMLAGEQLPRIC